MPFRQYDSDSLIVHPRKDSDPDIIVKVLPEQVGWKTIEFEVRSLTKGQTRKSNTAQKETAVIILSGTISVESNRGAWKNLGKRKDVFSGLPYALYLPIETTFIITAASDTEFALASIPAEKEFPARIISPQEVLVEIRGGDHATRQINNIIPPGFPCQHLVVVEVYTPGGNWSSFPPHKHDNRKVNAEGDLMEADLDEIYYYKLDKPEGFALQRVYTSNDSPLQKAHKGFDTALVVKDNDVVLVPEGFHPVSSPPGYMTYYLNILAGSDQVLTAEDDPNYAWIKNSYQSVDPRLPVYPVDKSNVRK